MSLRNNRMKKKIAAKYITDKETVSILSKNIEDLENFEHAVKVSCMIINKEKIHQFHLISCDIRLLNSKFYKQALDVFALYQNPKDCKVVRCILCDPILLNSKFYPIILKFLSINRDINYTFKIIYDILVDNIMNITPELFKIIIFLNENTNLEICSIFKNELITKEKVLDIFLKLSSGDNIVLMEKQIKEIITIIHRILYLEDRNAIKVLLNYLYNQVDSKFENNYAFSNKIQEKIFEQRDEIAKRKGLNR